MSQYEKTATIYYSLRAYCRDPFELKKLEILNLGNKSINGEWTGQNAGGCQNHSTYRNNPKYSLQLGPRDPAQLIVELRGPKVYQVGLEVIVSSLVDSTVTAPFVSKVTGSYRSGYCVLDLEKLPAGTYHIIPSTYLPGQESPFILNIRASTGIIVERIA